MIEDRPLDVFDLANGRGEDQRRRRIEFSDQRKQEPLEHGHGPGFFGRNLQAGDDGGLVADESALGESVGRTDGGLVAEQAVP